MKMLNYNNASAAKQQITKSFPKSGPDRGKTVHVDEDYGVHKHLETLIYRLTEQHGHRNGVVCISYTLQTV